MELKGCPPIGTIFLVHKGTKGISEVPPVAFSYLLAFHQMWLQFFPSYAVPKDHLIFIKMLCTTLKKDNLHHMVNALCPLWSLSSLKLDSHLPLP